MLVIQEQKFPATLSFALIEPSSRLVWKCAYEATHEIVSPSTFSVVDPGSLETFLTCIYNSMESQSILVSNPEHQLRMKGNWHQILK